MRYFNKFLIVTLVSFMTISASSQDVTQLQWLNELDKKSSATYGDAVKLFAMQSANQSSTFQTDLNILEKRGIALDGYAEDDVLLKGMLAKMTAKYLDLGKSIMYMIFGSERYAYKSCVSHGIMRDDGSENDIISGPELIEIFSKISDIKGEKE